MDGEAGWWTTSGNIGLPPLARVMGVGRQQQQEFTADLQSESGRKNCFRIARQMAREGRDVISVCCKKNDAGNVVSDADGMNNMWSKYMEKLLDVENDWDGEVDCSEVMGHHCLISEEEIAVAIKGLKIGKAAGPTGVVSEMMKAAGGFGSRLMTDLINNIVKEGCIPDDLRKSILVPVYKGKGDPLVCGSYRAIKLLDQPMKVLERVLEKRVRCQLITCRLASRLEREPLMPFSSCDKYKRNTKQRRRSFTILLWI